MKNEIIEKYIQKCMCETMDYSALMVKTIRLEDIPVTGKIAVFIHPMVGNYEPGMELHCHDYFEIIYVYKGTATQYLKNASRQLCNGDICVMNTNYKHGLSVPDKGCAVFNILVAKELINTSFLNLITENDLFSSFFIHSLFSVTDEEAIYFTKTDNGYVEAYMQSLIEEYILQKPCFQAAMQNYLSLIFTNLLRSHIYTVDSKLGNNIDLTEILAFISANIKDVTLNSLAEHFHYTPPYLSKIIKQYLGRTLSNLINELRLNKAADYLVDTNIAISDIVTSLGYYDRSYFNRSFRKYYGISPNEYRNTYKK